MLPTIEWRDDAIVMVDQRKLPKQERYVKCRTGAQVVRAIKTMVIRGAPAIGVAAAMGLAMGVVRSKAKGTTQLAAEFYKLCAGHSVEEVAARLRHEAQVIHDEDVESCRTRGSYGASGVPDKARVLTHCNAGALATAGYGTALGVIRRAVEEGKRVAVFAGETRPFLQGARLTAWELVRDGIDTTVITDSMAGSLMRDGQIDLVIVGADRIAANGDVANKIGTYSVAVLARAHDLLFYVAAPTSTIDLATPDGAHIPIEERNAREVTHLGASQLAPDGAGTRNPAFDVTPSQYVSAIITERGVCRPPYADSLREVVAGAPSEVSR